MQKTDLETQKIEKSLVKTFEIGIASFQVIDKLSKVWFF